MTRGYVVGLIGAVTILAPTLLVAAWGGISLATGYQPVRTDSVPFEFAPVVVAIVMAILVSLLWRAAVALLRGRRTPPIAEAVIAGFGAYLVWCLGGMLASLSVGETWLSVYPATLGAICALAPLLFWAVLSRRVYTDRRPPRWPWERHPAPDDLQYPDHPVFPEDDPGDDSGDPGRR